MALHQQDSKPKFQRTKLITPTNRGESQILRLIQKAVNGRKRVRIRFFAAGSPLKPNHRASPTGTGRRVSGEVACGTPGRGQYPRFEPNERNSHFKSAKLAQMVNLARSFPLWSRLQTDQRSASVPAPTTRPKHPPGFTLRLAKGLCPWVHCPQQGHRAGSGE